MSFSSSRGWIRFMSVRPGKCFVRLGLLFQSGVADLGRYVSTVPGQSARNLARPQRAGRATDVVRFAPIAWRESPREPCRT